MSFKGFTLVISFTLINDLDINNCKMVIMIAGVVLRMLVYQLNTIIHLLNIDAKC